MKFVYFPIFDVWKNMKSLVFTMETPNGDEVISTNLNSREALLENPKTTIGFDGKQVWLLNKTKEDYSHKLFKNYNEYTVSTKSTLTNVEEAIDFNNFHEGIHLGYILALKRSL